MNLFAIKRVDELLKQGTKKPYCHVSEFVDFAELGERTKSGEIKRVILYVRHSERPPIEVDDPTFGANLGLTEDGVKLCKEVGAALRDIPNLQAYASPARRTILTAEEILSAYGIENPNVAESKEIGLAGLYTSNSKVLHESYFKRGSVEVNDAYNNGDAVAGYIPRDDAAMAMFNYLVGPELKGNLLMVSHDVFIAAFMSSLSNDGWGLSTKNWVGFIQGAALTLEFDGWHMYRVVPNKVAAQSIFIQ